MIQTMLLICALHYPTDIVKEKLIAVVNYYSQQIRQDLCKVYGCDKKLARTIYNTPNCREFSRALKKRFEQDGITARVVSTLAHAYVTIYLNGEDWVIDPTYRQFYINGLISREWDKDDLWAVFDGYHMPEVLVVKKKDLAKTFRSFPLLAIWDEECVDFKQCVGSSFEFIYETPYRLVKK